jgi:predicted Abi (CAAX) family protease
MVRGDWLANASLAVASGTGRFQARQSWPDVLLSWRSLLPRGAHDAYGAEVLQAGLPLRVLRTKQIPGADPQFASVAPTTLLARLPVFRLLVTRFADSLFSPLFPAGGAWSAGILLCTFPLAFVRRQGNGFALGWGQWQILGRRMPLLLVLLLPAFAEELLFRGLLLHSAWEGVAPLAMVPWVALSVGVFVGFQALIGRRAAALRPRRRWRRLFVNHLSVPQYGLLEMLCPFVYLSSGSLWQAVLMHWLVIVLPWTWAGGQQGWAWSRELLLQFRSTPDSLQEARRTNHEHKQYTQGPTGTARD